MGLRYGNVYVYRLDSHIERMDQSNAVSSITHCNKKIPRKSLNWMLCPVLTSLSAAVPMDPTASGVFCRRMLSMVNSEDVNAIIQAQRHM